MNPLPALQLIFFLKWLAASHREIENLADVPRERLIELVKEYRPDLRERQQRVWAQSVFFLTRPEPSIRGYDAAQQVMHDLWPDPATATTRSRAHQWYSALVQRLSPPQETRSPARLRRVPLHAVPLYSSEDEAFASYLVDHWDALDRLSGDHCDLHPSVEQLRGREDVYVLLDSDLEAGEQISLLDLPGLLFWDRFGSTCYVTLRHRDTEQIKEAIRSLFAAIRLRPEISAVRTVQEELREVTRDGHGPVFHQHVYGGAAAQGMHVTQNVGLEPGQVPELCVRLRELAPTVRDDVREQFLGDIEILEDTEASQRMRVSAGQRIRIALTDGGSKVAAAAIIAGIEHAIRVISS